MAKEWSPHVKNMTTDVTVYSKIKEDRMTRIYSCRGGVFAELGEAILESAEYGNAALDFIVVQELWSRDRVYMVYNPKGAFCQRFDTFSEAAEKALSLQRVMPRPSEAKVQRRKEQYLQNNKKRIERAKRQAIEARKAEILAQRARAAELEKLKDVYGSW